MKIKTKIRYQQGFWIVECKNLRQGIALDIRTAWKIWKSQAN